MSYSIIGFGAVGQALAKAFARSNIEVDVATRRDPQALADAAAAIGPLVKPVKLEAAATADAVILATPFATVREIGKVARSWAGKLVIDATNAFGVPLADFKGLTASAVNAQSFPDAQFVKGFNHLPAAKMAADPDVKGGRRVIFFSSDDDTAFSAAAALAERLGFAPVSLGTLAEGGALTQARGEGWSPLNFQDLVKFE